MLEFQTFFNIKIINNSAIGDVINLSRELSLAVVDCDFPYDVPVELVENILKNNFESIIFKAYIFYNVII